MSALLEIQDLQVRFSTRRAEVIALDGVSLEVHAGETLGIVGESGCGKSITALAIMGLISAPSGQITAGSIKWDGAELVGASEARLRALRGAEMAMIFQEPLSALNPVFTVGDQIAEAIMLHRRVGYSQAFKEAVALLERVGIPSPDQRAVSYPHQLSGGMRQRVMIAMAVSCQPRLLIADEPTTALDVTVQAQIFDLLDEIQREFGLAIMLITHDMGVISEMADRVAVMYAGNVIEQGSADDVIDFPQHPYTKGLIACIPAHTPTGAPLVEIPGIVPPLYALGEGCAFADRCDFANDRCRGEKPKLRVTGHHLNACHGVAEGRL